MPLLISHYLDTLARELSFDRSLSRRVRDEIEDHLLESAERNPAGSIEEAERQAIARFGPAQAVAAQFVATSLLQRSRAAGLIIVAIVLGVFAAMKGRLVWYAATGWTVSAPAEFRGLATVTASFDRYAFYLALLAGACAWVHARSMPSAFDRKRLRRSFVLSAAVVAALSGSVLADVVLTALRLSAVVWSVALLIPVASIAIEVALVVILVVRIQAVMSLAATATLRFDL